MKLNEFRNRHSGEAVAVLGNGPSLDRYELRELPVKTIGMNRTWRRLISPYHVLLNNRAYWKEIEMRKWVPQVVFEPQREERHLRRFNPQHYAPQTVWIPRDDTNDTLDITKGAPYRLTGVLAIYVAVFLGFNPVWLLGYDCGPREGHFKTGERSGRFAQARDTKIDRTRLVGHFETLATRLKRHAPHVEVFNCNRGSSVTCFPYRAVDEIKAA